MNSEFPESSKILLKAEEALATATHDLNGEFYLAAVNRAYYACFYVMNALLLTQNSYAKTHQGVRSKFSELFIKTGIFPDKLAIYIKSAFDLRQEADYDYDTDISAETARLIVNNVTEMYRMATAHFHTISTE